MTAVSGRAVFLMPSSVSAALLATSGGPWGTVHVKWDVAQELGLIVGGTQGGEAGFERHTTFLDQHRSRYADVLTDFGVWYRADAVLIDLWTDMQNRDAALPVDVFKQHVPQGWKATPRDAVQLILTGAVIDGVHRWRAWNANDRQVVPIELFTVDENSDVLAPLDGLWPLEDLRSESAVLVGLGSLGTPAALALAAYGIGRITLVDPDRLQQHNLVRHVLDQSYLGHFKVAGVRDLIQRRIPNIDVSALALDVVLDADTIRPLIRDASIVIAAPDGVAPRQAVNHMARWGHTPAIFGAVFDDGGLGEVIRIRPDRSSACLSCHRVRLFRDELLEPERTLDLGYGTGYVHRPMTAVGPDIGLVGDLVAKVAVATILEAAGHSDQAVPGDQLVVGLRPTEGLDGPFAVDQPLAFKWSALGPPEAGCPDCDPA